MVLCKAEPPVHGTWWGQCPRAVVAPSGSRISVWKRLCLQRWAVRLSHSCYLQSELTISPQVVCWLSGFLGVGGDGGGLNLLHTPMHLPSCQREEYQEAEGPRCFPHGYTLVWPLKHTVSLLHGIMVSCQVLVRRILACPPPVAPICPGQKLHREGMEGQPSGRTVGLRRLVLKLCWHRKH